MNTQKLAVVILVIAILFSGVFVSKQKIEVTVPQQSINAGAATGPDNFFNCETHNGVQTCFAKQSFRQSTSTPVDIVSPTATSTLTYASCSYAGQPGAAVLARMFKGAALHATTTLLVSRSIATPGTLNFPVVASTTPIGTDVPTIFQFPPSNHFVFELNGVAGVSLTGSCSVEWKTI